MTRTGAILGTVRYMAPEQIDGREVDARSDLFSFGAVLFEMLTAKRAFDGDSATMVRAAILRHEPPPVSSLQPLAPPAIDAVVRRCLAKNPDERWRTAGDLVRELKQVFDGMVETRPQAPPMGAVPRARHAWKWVAAILIAALSGVGAWVMADGPQRWAMRTPSDQIRSVAVLPLENLSGDPEQEYFADGMTEQLIADLATIGRLRVISRASVMHYKQTRKAVPTIARELRVDAIVTGSIVRAGARVRIIAKLIRGAPEKSFGRRVSTVNCAMPRPCRMKWREPSPAKSISPRRRRSRRAWRVHGLSIQTYIGSAPGPSPRRQRR